MPNEPVPSDYRKYRQKAERPSVNNHPGKQPGVRRKPELLNEHSHNQETKTDRTTNDDLNRTTANTKAELWTEHPHKEEITPPIGQLSSNRGVGSEIYLEDKF